MEPAEDEYGDESCPNLDVDGVLAGSDEGFDFEVLFQGLEEEFDLPAVLIDCGDGRGAEFEVIGEEDDLALMFLVPDHDAAQFVRALALCADASEADDFIGDDVAVLGYGETADDAIVGVVFESGNEVDAFFGPGGEKLVVVEGLVHGDDGTGDEVEEAGELDFMLVGGGDVDEAGEIVSVVEGDVDFDPSLGAAELGPGEHFETEGDGGCVDGEERVVEAELSFLGEAALDDEASEGCVEELAEEVGGSMFIGVGEGGAGDGSVDAEVAEFAEAALEAAGDVAEGVGAGELTEHHGDELSPAGEAFSAPFGLVFTDESGEFSARKKMENLTEEAGNNYHSGVLLVCEVDGFSTIPSCHAKEDVSVSSCFGH